MASICASSLALIDGSVVNVALPAIGDALQASAAQLQWTVNAYLLPLSALLLFGGAAGDHLGRRWVLIVGIALFAFASIGCALAPGITVLLAARALQGVGAALLLPSSLAILGAAFSGEARGRAIGTWAAAGAIAGALGPPLGGWLVETAGWRWIFYLNLPLAIAAIVIAYRFIARDHLDAQGPGNDTGERSLDWAGAASSVLALCALTWALTRTGQAGQGPSGATTGALLVAGIILAAIFVGIEQRRGDQAMMPLAMFGSRVFVGLSILTFLVYGAFGGLMLLLPWLLITEGHYGAFAAGLALLPIPLVIGLASRPMGALAARVGARWPLTIGPALVAGGFGCLAVIDPQASYARAVLPGLCLLALGMAMTAAPLTTAVLAAVDERHGATASGFNSAIARAGGLVATALVGVVLGSEPQHLTGGFRWAAVVAVGLTAASALVAFVTLRGASTRPGDEGR